MVAEKAVAADRSMLPVLVNAFRADDRVADRIDGDAAAHVEGQADFARLFRRWGCWPSWSRNHCWNIRGRQCRRRRRVRARIDTLLKSLRTVTSETSKSSLHHATMRGTRGLPVQKSNQRGSSAARCPNSGIAARSSLTSALLRGFAAHDAGSENRNPLSDFRCRPGDSLGNAPHFRRALAAKSLLVSAPARLP